MKEKKKKQGKNIANILIFVLLLVCSAGIGFLVGKIGADAVPEDTGFLPFMAGYLLQFVFLVLAFLIQLIIHEGGHLLAGLLTGYRFSSFRIGSLMLLKTSDGYSFKRFSLAGTGGQCLLIPPERRPDGSYPYRLYHLGGVLLNVITAVLAFGAYALVSGAFLFYLAICGVLCALMNGIPLRAGGLATDGYNVLHIGKEPFALDAMWLQLKINAAQTEGVRLRELPEEWFEIPPEASKHNEIISSVAVFRENRAMDALDFEQVKELIAQLRCSEDYTVIGLYQSLLTCDEVTVDLIEHGAAADTALLNTRQCKAFRKAMAKFPAVIRTEYAVALLKEHDRKKAQKCRELFSEVAKRYPARSDLDSETEIMDYLDHCSEEHR